MANRRRLLLLLTAFGPACWVNEVAYGTTNLTCGAVLLAYAAFGWFASDYRSAFPKVHSVPKLGGQQAAYIVKALQEYKAGSRKHATMRSITATLSDEEMAALARYYAQAVR